ncbi:hypothetical protein EMIT0P253_110099 [Pseudomonas sp. IT-P253]
MIAPAKARKFTLYRAQRQGLTAERLRYAVIAPPVAAGEACVRLRSSRKPCLHGAPEIPRVLILRLLRSRTQASPAATKRASPPELLN